MCHTFHHSFFYDIFDGSKFMIKLVYVCICIIVFVCVYICIAMCFMCYIVLQYLYNVFF